MVIISYTESALTSTIRAVCWMLPANDEDPVKSFVNYYDAGLENSDVLRLCVGKVSHYGERKNQLNFSFTLEDRIVRDIVNVTFRKTFYRHKPRRPSLDELREKTLEDLQQEDAYEYYVQGSAMLEVVSNVLCAVSSELKVHPNPTKLGDE